MFVHGFRNGLSVVGTAVMFLVGGGILTHGLPGAHELIQHWTLVVGALPVVGAVLAAITPTLLDGLGGILAGALVLAGVSLGSRGWQALRNQQA